MQTESAAEAGAVAALACASTGRACVKNGRARSSSAVETLLRVARIRVPLLPAAALAAVGLIAMLAAGPLLAPVTAAQPYGPVEFGLSVRAQDDGEVIAVVLSGLQPNSSVEAVSEGRYRSSGVVDAAGVVQVDIPLPEAITVEVRGISADGAPLLLMESIPFPRFAADGQSANGALEPSASRSGVLWTLTLVAVVAAGLAVAGRVLVRRGVIKGVRER